MTLSELQAAGEAQLGEALRVEVWDMPWPTAGCAWIDLEGRRSIAVARNVAADPAQLERVFWHELAHHRAGDCPQKADPTWETLAEPFADDYAEWPRERFADNYALLQRYVKELGRQDPMSNYKQPAPVERAAQGGRATWLELADRATSELKDLTPKLRRRLDSMPKTQEREVYRNLEIDAGSQVRTAPGNYRSAFGPRMRQSAEKEARKGAADMVKVCKYAGLPVPASVARLAAGEGTSVPEPLRTITVPMPTGTVKAKG